MAGETGGLEGDACGVMNIILRPPDHLIEVVGSGRKAVISTRERGKSLICPVPKQPEIDKATLYGGP